MPRIRALKSYSHEGLNASPAARRTVLLATEEMSQAQYPLEISDEVPDFTLDSQMGSIDFHDLIDGKWCLLVTFSSAFDPVATTDIGALCKMSSEFEARNIVVVTMGNDTIANYRRWSKDIEELQAVKVSLPLMCDNNCTQLKKFGCARDFPLEGGKSKPTCLGAFLIDIDRRIRVATKYSLMTGRNFYEFLRVFDALNLAIHHKCLVPSNWASGQEVMLSADMTKDEAALFRYSEIKPWFRVMPDPLSLT